MSGSFEFSVHGDHVLITCAVTVSPEAARELFATAPERVRSAGTDRVLIDMRGTAGEVTTTDRYFYAVDFAAAFRGLKVAVVQSEAFYDPRGFGQTVAANRGAHSRNFTSMDAARAWLLSDDDEDEDARLADEAPSR